MLAEQYGKVIREARLLKGMKQEELATKAKVSRAILSRLEQGPVKAIQSDTLDKLLAALDLNPQIGQANGTVQRKMLRLEQEIKRREQKERHLRLAISLGEDASGAAAKMAKARKRVELWRSNRTCSLFYIDRWSRLLALPPRKLAKEMSSLGEWEDAMFQNTPWSWAWN
ncbi:MAG: helix-turn-helix domain-containing protein [Burkholderiales bacterium]